VETDQSGNFTQFTIHAGWSSIETDMASIEGRLYKKTTSYAYSNGYIPTGAIRKGTGLTTDSNGALALNTSALPSELPSISSGDAGKVLAVNSGETGVEWATVSGGDSLPSITISTANGNVNKSSLDADAVSKLDNLFDSSKPVSANQMVIKQIDSNYYGEYRYVGRNTTSGYVFFRSINGKYVIRIQNMTTYYMVYCSNALISSSINILEDVYGRTVIDKCDKFVFTADFMDPSVYQVDKEAAFKLALQNGTPFVAIFTDDNGNYAKAFTSNHFESAYDSNAGDMVYTATAYD
jgi:hypothetical protein